MPQTRYAKKEEKNIFFDVDEMREKIVYEVKNMKKYFVALRLLRVWFLLDLFSSFAINRFHGIEKRAIYELLKLLRHHRSTLASMMNE